MIKRLLLLIFMAIGLMLPASALQEETVKLDKGDNRVKSVKLNDVAYATFEYLYDNNDSARVRLTFVNLTDQSILLFKTKMTEKGLKDGKPKIEFEKKIFKHSTDKYVDGCGLTMVQKEVVITKDTLFLSFNVPFDKYKTINLPFYIAKCNKPKDVHKKKYELKYKILQRYDYSFNVTVENKWTEDDAEYVEQKDKVDAFFAKLSKDTFCPTGKHKKQTNAKEQKYLAERDDLKKQIEAILRNNNGWMSTDPAHKAYTALITRLNSLNIKSYEADCGRHRPIPPIPPIPPKHHCGYCSLSSRQLFEQLDSLYQSLKAKGIKKENAQSRAKALMRCYQLNENRKKDSLSDSKINKYYKNIINFR